MAGIASDHLVALSSSRQGVGSQLVRQPNRQCAACCAWNRRGLRRWNGQTTQHAPGTGPRPSPCPGQAAPSAPDSDRDRAKLGAAVWKCSSHSAHWEVALRQTFNSKPSPVVAIVFWNAAMISSFSCRMRMVFPKKFRLGFPVTAQGHRPLWEFLWRRAPPR